MHIIKDLNENITNKHINNDMGHYVVRNPTKII